MGIADSQLTHRDYEIAHVRMEFINPTRLNFSLQELLGYVTQRILRDNNRITNDRGASCRRIVNVDSSIERLRNVRER